MLSYYLSILSCRKSTQGLHPQQIYLMQQMCHQQLERKDRCYLEVSTGEGKGKHQEPIQHQTSDPN